MVIHKNSNNNNLFCIKQNKALITDKKSYYIIVYFDFAPHKLQTFLFK